MQKNLGSFILALFCFLAISASKPCIAVDLIVEEHPTDPSHFSSIQEAINFANNLLTTGSGTTTAFRVRVERGTYGGPITLASNIPILGREIAKTTITGSGTLITGNNVTSVSIRNLTIKNAGTGILITGNSSVDIVNNVFDTCDVAVQVQNSAGSSVINNTFFQNVTAIARDNDSVAITNNIFYNTANTVQISQSGSVMETTIKYNIFFPDINGAKGSFFIPNDLIPSPDPLFVDPANGDFHIRFSDPLSPAIDQGDPSITDAIDGATSDIGAYGGGNADTDTIPFIVSGVTVTLSGTDSASVSWLPNNSYVVTNTDPTKQGGYNVHYSLNKSGPPYDNKATEVSTSTSTIISGLTGTTTQPPGRPALNEPDFADATLILSWSSASGATSYILSYTDTTVSSPTNTVDIGNTTSHMLTGLINGHQYDITVTAVARSAYHFSVTAFDFTVKAQNGGTPGESHESNYSTPEAILTIGEEMVSEPSNTVTGIPDFIISNPNLPNKGCFIATAAFGYYSAPQVQVLRDFRDRYLITNRPGKAFVEWYYRHGPIGAAFITAHPWLKPVVRAALMPAIGAAYVLVHMPLQANIAVFGSIGLCLYLLGKRKRPQSGGVR